MYPTVKPSYWRSVLAKDTDRYYLMASSDSETVTVGGTFTVGGNRNVFTRTALPINTWTHLAVTFDGAMIRIYVNGVQVATQAQTGALTTSTSALMIGSNAFNERFIGRIDEVRVYNRALTVAEIQADMAAPIRP